MRTYVISIIFQGQSSSYYLKGEVLKLASSLSPLDIRDSSVVRLSKKAIASFKIRKGMPVGLSVTLRKNIMMEFYDRLVNIAMPRIKDFRGYSKKSFDGQGNITIGIKDHIIFPEISVENVENIFGFDITIATSATNDKEGYELLKLMNFPFLN